MNRLVLTALLILAALPVVSAAHSHSSDAPLWARSADYATPQQNTIWYDDTRNRNTYRHGQTRYVYHDIYHPPRVWVVHRNDNFYRTNAGTSRTHSRYRSGHSYRSDGVYHGDGFSRYY